MDQSEYIVFRSDLLLSTQRALLGAIDTNILGICINSTQNSVRLTVFVEGSLSVNQIEVLDIVGTEIAADIGPLIDVDVQAIENAHEPLETMGAWVFLRYGCLVKE